MPVGWMFWAHMVEKLGAKGRLAVQIRNELVAVPGHWAEQVSTWCWQLVLMVGRANSERWLVLPMEALESISMTVEVPLAAQASCWFWPVPKVP